MECKCQGERIQPNDQSILHMTLKNHNDMSKMKSAVDKILIYGYCHTPIRRNSIEIWIIGWIKFKDFGILPNGGLNIVKQYRGKREVEFVTDIASKFMPLGKLASNDSTNS